jgi:hypothetical protein
MCWFSLCIVLIVAGISPAGDPLPPGAMLRLGETRFRAGGEVIHLHFSPDGAVLLGWAVGSDGEPHPVAWEATTGIAVSPPGIYVQPDIPERTTPAARLTGDRIVTAGPGCSGRVWDASTGRQLALLSGHSAIVTAVAVSHDGKRIATGSADGLIKIWDADLFRPVYMPCGHTSKVRTIHVSADSKRAVTTGDDQSARVWDLKNGQELRGFATKGPVELTSDGNAVLTSIGGETTLRDVLTGLEVVATSRPTPPTHTIVEMLGQIGLSLAFSPDGRTVAVAHRDGTIGLYETATGQLRRILVGHRSHCGAMVFTPDGSRLLTGGGDHSVLVWAVRVQDVTMPVQIQLETRAGKLWTIMTTGTSQEAYLAMARFAAEPPAAVKMARLSLLHAADAAETLPETRLAQARGVELLESLGTDAARDFLEELANGVPTAHLTQEASRALKRLTGEW